MLTLPRFGFGENMHSSSVWLSSAVMAIVIASASATAPAFALMTGEANGLSGQEKRLLPFIWRLLLPSALGMMEAPVGAWVWRAELPVPGGKCSQALNISTPASQSPRCVSVLLLSARSMRLHEFCFQL